MLNTVEIVAPKLSDRTTNAGKYVLYEAFRNMTDCVTVKDYARWRSHNNEEWSGGLTAGGNLSALRGAPYSVVLRERDDLVQLVAVNKDVWETDRAEDYKKNGWEFSETDSSILMDAKYYKCGENNGKIIISGSRNYDAPVSLIEAGERRPQMHEGLTASLVRKIAFEELLKVILITGFKGYPARHVLTSPVWRAYNVVQDKAVYKGGGLR